MGRRTWIKVYCDKWLEGTLREETPEVRAVWIDLLALAGSGQYGDTGEIKLSNGIGFTDAQIAEILHIPVRLWRRAKDRFIETDRIEVTRKGAIHIKNWTKYQSEYRRQKPYRQQRPDDSTDGTRNTTHEPESPLRIPLEKEKEMESEELQGEVTNKGYSSNPLNPPSLGDFATTRCPSYRGLTAPLASQDTSIITKLVAHLRGNGPSTPGQLSDALDISINSVRAYLSILKRKGRVTNPEHGKWVLGSTRRFEPVRGADGAIRYREVKDA